MFMSLIDSPFSEQLRAFGTGAAAIVNNKTKRDRAVLNVTAQCCFSEDVR